MRWFSQGSGWRLPFPRLISFILPLFSRAKHFKVSFQFGYENLHAQVSVSYSAFAPVLNTVILRQIIDFGAICRDLSSLVHQSHKTTSFNCRSYICLYS